LNIKCPMLLAAVILLTFLMPTFQRAKATQDTATEEMLNRAIDYLVNNYNATMGLIAEVPNGTTYWIYSDNFLASFVLARYDPNNLTLTSISTNISDTISRYMSSYPDALNQYMVLESPVWAFNASNEYMILSHGNVVINATFNNQTDLLSSCDYADIAFLKALYFNYDNQTQASLDEFRIGAGKFDGRGMNDTAFQSGKSKGQYQIFKLALYIYVSRILKQPYPQDRQSILLNMQASSGGFYTGYDENFSSNGTNTNVETTCLAILALKEPLIPEFQYQILAIFLVISTALVVLLKKLDNTWPGTHKKKPALEQPHNQ